jgi:folate-binding protein YgfZ
MNRSLRETLLRSGAVINGASRLALHFGEPEAELRAALDSCALVDRSDLTRLLAGGPDILDLLHRLSTGEVGDLGPGQGRPTVLTSPKGRIVERLFVHHLGETGVLLIAGASSADSVTQHLQRYTFAEQTGLRDWTEATCQLALVGPGATEALQAAGFTKPERFQGSAVEFEGRTIHALGEDGLTGDGYSFVVPADLAGSLWQTLGLAVGSSGGCPAGTLAAEAWRVLRGIPAAARELTEDYNPLEAGLREAVSFDKGCYVGQEVVARLNTYDKVARLLVGLVLPPNSDPPPYGTPLFFQDREVGRVTSALVPPGWKYPVALAYLKQKSAEPGIELAVGRAKGDLLARMVALPFDETS